MKKIVWQTATIALLVGLSTSTTWGQSADPQAIAAAQSLVDEAGDLMDAGKFDAACPKLEQATKLVPTGVGARLALAECYVGQGKLASAQGQYLQAEALANAAKDPKRAREAGQEAAKLKSKIATITLTFRDDISQIAGISVTWDDIAWDPKLANTPIPVDVGNHRLRVTAPGYKPWTHDVNIKENGSTSTQIVPMLEKLPAPPKQIAGPAPIKETKSTGTPIPWVGFGLMIVGVGTGAGFTIAAINKNKDSSAAAEKLALNRNVNETICPVTSVDPACSNLRELESRRNLFAQIGIASLAVGGVAGAASVIFVFTHSNKNNGSAKNDFVVVPFPGGISIAGTF